MMTLDEFLKQYKKTGEGNAKSFAAAAGISHITLSRIRNGASWPSGKAAEGIARASGGQVYFKP